MKFQTIFCLIFLFYFQAQSADFIKLKDGNGGTITTLDTTGNLVTYIRNGSKVTLNKTLIDYITIGKDTISYIGFVPDENAIHKESIIIKPNNPPTQNDRSTFESLDHSNNEQYISTAIKNSLNANFKTQLKIIGGIQIGGAIVNQILVIYDATRKETFSTTIDGKKYSQNFQHKWTIGHTMLTILNGLFLSSGITTLTINF